MKCQGKLTIFKAILFFEIFVVINFKRTSWYSGTACDWKRNETMGLCLSRMKANSAENREGKWNFSTLLRLSWYRCSNMRLYTRRSWVPFSLGEMKYLVYSNLALITIQTVALSSASQHAMPQEFGGN